MSTSSERTSSERFCDDGFSGDYKFRCPKDKEHKEFITSVKVSQDWLVDGDGRFIEISTECTVIYEYPCDGNYWMCATCGTEAVQEDEND